MPCYTLPFTNHDYPLGRMSKIVVRLLEEISMSLFRLSQGYCSVSWPGYFSSVSKIGSISCQQLYRTHNSNSTNMEQEIEIAAMYQELRYGQLSGSRQPAKTRTWLDRDLSLIHI